VPASEIVAPAAPTSTTVSIDEKRDVCPLISKRRGVGLGADRLHEFMKAERAALGRSRLRAGVVAARAGGRQQESGEEEECAESVSHP
jgi:hypothetical protein